MSLAPLQDLPAPRPLPALDPQLVLPQEFVLDSRRDLARRLLRRAWGPALVLWGLWLLLSAAYILGAAPSFWVLTLIFSLAEPSLGSSQRAAIGFSWGDIARILGLVPLLGTALSLAALPLSSALVARLRPQEHLGEEDFQRAVSARAAAPLLIAPCAAIALLLALVVLQVPLQWRALAAGPLGAVAFGLGMVLIAFVILRRVLSASRLLGIEPAEALRQRLQGTATEDAPLIAARLLVQDRRHLPPTDSLQEQISLAGFGRALRVAGREWLSWVVPAALASAWLIFTAVDAVVMFARLLETDGLGGSQTRSELPWTVYAAGIPIAALLVAGMGAAPFAAMRLARSRRGSASDLRTYPLWEDRVRVNPWEASVVRTTGWLHGAMAIGAIAALTAVLLATGTMTGAGWAWIIADALLLAPLIGAAGASAMRRGLREVVYGPAGRYVRRPVPWMLVAPLHGTRADRAADPRVRAEQRRREIDAAGVHGLLLLDAPLGETAASSGGAPGEGADGKAGGPDPAALPDFGASADQDTARRSRGPATHAIPRSETVLRGPRS